MPDVFYSDSQITLYHGDSLAVLKQLPDASVDCCVTSPPYFGLRDYGQAGQYGLEASPAEYVETMRVLFAEVRRVLADDGTLWLNLGDSHGRGSRPIAQPAQTTERGRKDHRPQGTESLNLPNKSLVGIPWRTALALAADGWVLRSEIIWHKATAMPERVLDRPRRRHEHVFLLSKRESYWFDLDGLSEQGDVWYIVAQPFAEAHFAVMPASLAEQAILSGCKPGGTVLDPFSGSGTTGMAATKHGRKYVGIDLSADYLDLSLRTRFAQPGLDFGGVA